MVFILVAIFVFATVWFLPRAANWAGMPFDDVRDVVDGFLGRYDRQKEHIAGYPQLLLMKKLVEHDGVYSFWYAAVFLVFNVIIWAWALLNTNSTGEMALLLNGTLLSEYLIFLFLAYRRRHFYQKNLEMCQRCYSASCRLVGRLVDSSREGSLPSHGRIVSFIMSVGGSDQRLDIWLPQVRYPLIAWGLKGDVSTFGPSVAVFLEIGKKNTPPGIKYVLSAVSHDDLLPHMDLDLCMVSKDLKPYLSETPALEGNLTLGSSTV